MFFNLLQLVFHTHDQNLYVVLVCLRAGGVDFATHLLGNETELLALIFKFRDEAKRAIDAGADIEVKAVYGFGYKLIVP